MKYQYGISSPYFFMKDNINLGERMVMFNITYVPRPSNRAKHLNDNMEG